jgi:hypothetical protein
MRKVAYGPENTQLNPVLVYLGEDLFRQGQCHLLLRCWWNEDDDLGWGFLIAAVSVLQMIKGQHDGYTTHKRSDAKKHRNRNPSGVELAQYIFSIIIYFHKVSTLAKHLAR